MFYQRRRAIQAAADAAAAPDFRPEAKPEAQAKPKRQTPPKGKDGKFKRAGAAEA